VLGGVADRREGVAREPPPGEGAADRDHRGDGPHRQRELDGDEAALRLLALRHGAARLVGLVQEEHDDGGRRVEDRRDQHRRGDPGGEPGAQRARTDHGASRTTYPAPRTVWMRGRPNGSSTFARRYRM
jgi:hypothetical protein